MTNPRAYHLLAELRRDILELDSFCDHRVWPDGPMPLTKSILDRVTTLAEEYAMVVIPPIPSDEELPEKLFEDKKLRGIMTWTIS